MGDIFPELDLLTITEATAALPPGKRLPKPFLDLSVAKPKKGKLSLASNHHYWLRSQITALSGKGSPKKRHAQAV